ncbi:MAG: hypothetical protein WC675_04445 [Patescibacteria group bacterium]|jgi:hypothetical protein
MYGKKLKNVIMVAIISAVISALIGFVIFEMDWPFLPFPLLAGVAIILVQKETTSLKFLDKLLLGALLFGFLTSLLIFTRTYLGAHFIVQTNDFPWWPLSNPKEFLLVSLVFSFVCFMGGLVGIVIKGFYSIIKK